MPNVHKKCCQLLVENIHITTTFELLTENVVAKMLATEESVCVWPAFYSDSIVNVAMNISAATLEEMRTTECPSIVQYHAINIYQNA